MEHEHQELSTGEILLLGCWMFYGGFVATNTVFYGYGFLIAIGIGLPVVLLAGMYLIRRPDHAFVALAIFPVMLFHWPFRALLLLAILIALVEGAMDQLTDLHPTFPTKGISAKTFGVAILLGVPLSWSTWRARKRRIRPGQEDRRAKLARFERRARRVVGSIAKVELLSESQLEFVVDIEGGEAIDLLEDLIDIGDLSGFDEEISRMEAELDRIERLGSREGHAEKDGVKGSTDPYEVLMCLPDSSFETVKQAYKSYCRHYHPDSVQNRGGNVEIAHHKMQEGNLAFEEIKRRRGIQ